MPQVSTSFSTKIHYQKTGVGPVIFLLHGFPESSLLWSCISGALSAAFTIIMPDFPGSGDSPITGSVSINQMAEAVKAIMDAEGVSKAVIAGHSMGGYVAFAFAKQYPSAVMGLSSIHSTPLADDDEKKQMRRKAIEIIRKGGKETFIRQMVMGLFSDKFKQNCVEVVEQQIENSLTVSEEGLINYYTAMIERSERVDVLDEASFPIQWIAGDSDKIIPFEKNLRFCYKTGVNFVSFYNGCAHMSMFEAPDRLIEDLKKFTTYCYNIQ